MREDVYKIVERMMKYWKQYTSRKNQCSDTNTVSQSANYQDVIATHARDCTKIMQVGKFIGQ